MILEHAILDVNPGKGREFEAAIAAARVFIAGSAGFQGMEVRACVETADRYLLLVWWDSLESHTQGFRQSENYSKWRAALHHFYEPFPIVEHYRQPLGR